MSQRIKRAAVLGSGVMGSGIAAHLANIGIPTLMLDIVPNKLTEAEEQKGLTLEDKVVRNRIAEQSKQALKKQKPSPITSKKSLDLIVTGNMEDDMEKLADVDWIIEVVVERLDIKKQVFAQVDQHRKAGTIVTSNTSGISVEAMIEDCSDDMKEHFLGTHFFNPPRYLKLLEDRKSTRLNSSHVAISYAVFCLKKKKFNTKVLDKSDLENMLGVENDRGYVRYIYDRYVFIVVDRDLYECPDISKSIFALSKCVR